MGEIKPHRPVLLILGALSRYDEALDWTCQIAQRQWGEVALHSERFPFTATRYYEPSMGEGLQKVFFAFRQLADPAVLPSVKRLTNDWEDQYRRERTCRETRPLNLDPGYLTEAKLVLASTKDRDQRLYLGDGVFGEITLYHQRGAWRGHAWTYRDYQQAEYHAFLSRCRDYLREQYRQSGQRTL